MASPGIKMDGSAGPNGQAAVVEYALSVVQEIQTLALEGARSGFSGVEVGGVLFGKREDRKIRILTLRPLAGNYSLGPHFAVSEEDLSALQDLLTEAPKIRKLRGLEPVGWYRSQLDSDLTLADRDLQIFERFFPDSSQVGVLLQATEFAPTRVRFYFCSREGGKTHQTSYREFILESAEADAMQSPPAAAPEAAPEAPPEAVPEAPQAEISAAPAQSAKSWSALAGWLLALALAVGLGGTLAWLMRPSQRLALQLQDAQGQLQITWNETARPVRNAQSAALEITDGNANTWLELDLDQLRRGNVTYVRRSNMVAVRLKIQPRGSAPVEEVARFLGPPEPLQPSTAAAGTLLPTPAPERPAVSPPASVAQLPAKPPQLPIAKEVVPIQPKSDTPLPANPQIPEKSTPARVEQVAQVAQAVPQTAPATVPATSLPPAETVTQPAAAPPPPVVEKPIAQPAVSLPANPAPAKPPVATVGRLIWTGQLPKNSTVTITGRKASAGALTGELPGKSVRIAVYPGDLSAGGIVIFTPHTQYAKPLAENPSAQTGWNKATYTFNPQRSGDVIVEESPGAQNGWNRMVLRSKTGRFSVIVVDWTLLPQ